MDGGWPPGSDGPGEPGLSARDIWRERYGRGKRHPVTGAYEWYEFPPEVAAERSGESVTWVEILTRWALVEADLHERYGVDVEDRALMRSRSWRWLETRILGLLDVRSRLAMALQPPDHQQQ